MALNVVKQWVKKVPFLYRLAVRFVNEPFLRRVWYYWKKRGTPRLRYLDDLKSEAPSRGWIYTPVAPMTIQTHVPSKTIPEDTLEIVQHAGRLVRSHRRCREAGLDRLYKLWYANLLSVTRYPVYETFTCEIPDVFICLE